MTTAAQQVAATIADLERRLAAVERTAQLPYSSLDDGTLTINDADGLPQIALGKQDDGSFSVAGFNGGQVVATDLDLPGGTITETMIADDAISTPKLTANAITADKIEAGAILGQSLGSPNYVPGTSGFAIDGATGIAEFNDAILRGTLDVGSPGANVLITATIPTELVTFYTTQFSAIILNYVILQYTAVAAYHYEITFSAAGTVSKRLRARGSVVSGVVFHASVEGTSQLGLNNALFAQTGAPTGTGQGTWSIQNTSVNFGAAGQPGEDLQYASTSLGRGVTLHEQIPALFTIANTTAAQLIYTTALIAWQPGRAYRVEFSGSFRAGAPSRPAVQIRKTNASGTVLVEGPRPLVDLSGGGVDDPVTRLGYVVNDTGVVVNAALALVYTQPATPVSGSQMTATSGASVAFINVTDVGEALSTGGRVTGVSV